MNVKTGIIVLSALIISFAFTYHGPKPIRQKQPAGYMYCPAGKFFLFIYIDLIPDSFSMMAFWMKETEVTNAEYAEFLKDLKDSGNISLYKLCYPDTVLLHRDLWLAYYHVDYFTHPYFRNHPVVGITPTQANEYCNWLTKKYVKQNPDFSESFFMIPNYYQWIYAARGGRKWNSYPWGSLTQNSRGSQLANYSQNEMMIKLDERISNLYFIYYYSWVYENLMKVTNNLQTEIGKKSKHPTILWGLPLKSDGYFPNDFGLYNMCGNVAEMTSVSRDSFTYVGGSFRTEARYMNLNWMLPHPYPAPAAQADVGFRPVMTYIPPKKK